MSNDSFSIGSNNVTTTIPPSLSTLPQRISFVLFPCMVLTGVICNTLIFIIMRRRRMCHLSTCYYMGILAIADTSVLLLGLTVMWFYFLNRKWSLLLQSTYGCKLISLLFYSVSHISVWIVCMMSADRCTAIIRPLHASSICTVRRARISVCLLVLCMVLINIHFLFTHYLSLENECTSYKEYEFFMRRIWPWIDAAVYSALPFILLSTINLIIVHGLFRARRSTSSLQLYQTQRARTKNKLSTSMSRKLTTMLLAVTIFFLLTSFPMVCLQIYTNIIDPNTDLFTQNYIKPLCETLQYSNHCINFFLYAITGKAFRHELKRLFHSMAIKMRLTKSTIQTPLDKRQLGNHLNDRMNEHDIGKQRVSRTTKRLLQWQTSIDRCANSGTSVKRNL
ncbi:unnamed protein product [Rotaria socialis]|uniref:G-protein coupled receptors family 1 profile domain-containing protein n=2 Tax=Rotaria socialis TaxID=392032 RepID=A0A818U457_9BILA|nr:unnamed protein product [Rotaria socialis]CAF3695980.1 unnamed protein product [Rotaria socialis]CAF4246000.1 unnamed protein product [Rotaria socialis]CAF4465605.1 unnamed protein product [Rotaria socialis]CAF4470361.1 unnamed protein product [Rotaria socialis]